MSTFPEEQLGFFDTVQFYFTEMTDRAALLSGRDLELLSRWRRDGASARTICRGIREAVQAMPDDDPPRSIWACRKYIEPYVERAAERRAGENKYDGGDGERATDDGGEPPASDATGEASGRDEFEYAIIERTLEKIERAGRACDSEPRREAYRAAWRRVRRLRERAAGDDEDAVDRSEAFEELVAIEEALVDAYFRALDESARERIREQIRRDHGDLLDDMSEEARRDHILARKRRILIEEFELQPLLE